MKNSKVSGFVFAIVVIMSNAVQSEENNNNRVEELGRLFHYGANGCKKCSPEYRKKLETTEDLAAPMTYAEFLAALNFKIDGKDPIAVAKAHECVTCDQYAQMWENARIVAQFMVNDLKAGHLTRKEILQNPELAKRMGNFETELWNEQQ